MGVVKVQQRLIYVVRNYLLYLVKYVKLQV